MEALAQNCGTSTDALKLGYLIVHVIKGNTLVDAGVEHALLAAPFQLSQYRFVKTRVPQL